jgi:glycosyltransferase involved in cell wall biosynthesis
VNGSVLPDGSPVLNVLHTVRSLRLDGVGKVIVRNLAHGDHERFRHYVCSLRDESGLTEECRAVGVEPVFLGHRGMRSIPITLVRLVRLIRALRIDVVHTNRTLDFALAGLAARLCGVPVISSIHWLGRLEEHPEDRDRQPWIRRWSEMTATVVLHRLLATRVIAVSRAVKASYGSLPGFPVDRTEVVYPGAPMSGCSASEAATDALRSRLGLDRATPILLNVGRLDVVKGQLKLVPMMRAVREQLRDAKLLIAGEGELRGRLQAEIAREGLSDAIVLLGARSDVDALLQISDALVVSSDSEAFGLPLLEAMRAGKPVVTTDAGGVSELVDDGVNGYVVARDDPAAMATAVLRVLTEPGKGQQMGRAGRQLAEARFDLRASVRRLEALYREVARPVRREAEPTTAVGTRR